MAETSEQMFARLLAQMGQQSKWNSPQNLINLATLGLSGMAGLSQGAQQGRAQEMSLEEQAYQRAQDAYARRMAGRNGLQGAIMDQLQRRDQAGVNVANASPLGWDQEYRQKMAGQRANSLMAENFQPLRPGPNSTVGGFVAQTPNLLGAFATPDYRSAISPGATEQSIGDRRTVIEGLRADRPEALSRENQLMELLNAQMMEAAAPRLAPYGNTSATPSAPAPKKKGFWSKLGSIALPVAGLAANFIPGVGPVAGAILSGLGGAAGAKAGGAGFGHSLLAGAGNAAAGYGMSKAGLGGGMGTPKTFNNAMSSASLPAGMWGANPTSLPLQNAMNPLASLSPYAGRQASAGIGSAIRGQNGVRPAMPPARPGGFGGGTTRGGGVSGSWAPAPSIRAAIAPPSGRPFADANVGSAPASTPSAATSAWQRASQGPQQLPGLGSAIMGAAAGQPSDVVMQAPHGRLERIPVHGVPQALAAGYRFSQQ